MKTDSPKPENVIKENIQLSAENDPMVDFRSRRRRGIKRLLFKLVSTRQQSLRGMTNIVFLSKLATFAFYGLIVGVVIGFGLFLWYGRDLPTPGKLVNNDLSQSTRIYDRN